MNNELEIFKKKLIYRASYRGTKEMDILLSSFVNKNIDLFDMSHLLELDKFLNFDFKEPSEEELAAKAQEAQAAQAQQQGGGAPPQGGAPQ